MISRDENKSASKPANSKPDGLASTPASTVLARSGILELALQGRVLWAALNVDGM